MNNFKILKHLKILYALILVLLMSSNLKAQKTADSSKQLFIQGGLFNTYPQPNIKGFGSLNIGFFGIKTKNGLIGCSAKYRFGKNDEIVELTRLAFDGTTFVDSFYLAGGNRTLKEMELTIDYKRKYLNLKKINAGIIYSVGYSQRSILNNPNPDKNIIDLNSKAILFSFNPYFEFNVNQNISLFCDVSFIKIKLAKTISTINYFDMSSERSVVPEFRLETPYTINELDFGFIININN